MTQNFFQYFWLVGFALYLAWGIASGGFDTAFAGLAQKRRRKRYRANPTADPVQAMLDEHAAVMASNAAVAAAIVTPEGVRQAFAGHVDGKNSLAPAADTLFEIGSIGKTFTAALLVAMVNRGQVALDEPLDHLLPANSRLGRQLPVPVTLESLATHCSGLPRLPWGWRMLAGLYFTPRQPYRFITERVLWRWLRHRRVSLGNRYRYSNLGYGVLGQVLARRAGLDWTMQRRCGSSCCNRSRWNTPPSVAMRRNRIPRSVDGCRRGTCVRWRRPAASTAAWPT